MGIPSFYRWLVERYPKVVADAIEEAPVVVNGVSVPVDLTGKNPNGIEYDNLYLDMNGIIHPCFHPEGLPAPETYEEVFQSVFKYLDKLFSVIRPRKLLYMAIDGVAPRAKMNQQRARRFRAAKDAADEASRIRESEGEDFTISKKNEKMDSNVITPGTEFMMLLSSALRYYVYLRMNNEPGWRGIKVIISDASVPGEGEHKIMSYIRLQRNLPGFRPNTTHCLYGLDADLIMLALATHEIHFSVLREEVRKLHVNDKSSKDRNASSLMNSHKDMESQGEVYMKNMEAYIKRQKFQFLHIWTLRDYLRHDLRIPDKTVQMDLERLIDDFVFMCIFVGNDFLPHVPSLEISEGAIDLLMVVYKKQFVQMGGYLTNSYEVNLKSVEQFVQAVGSHEDEIFRKRTQVQREREMRFRGSSNNSSSKKNKSSSDQILDNANPTTDQVKLGEDGWKERFYAQKFEAKTDDDREEIRQQAVQKYVEGICWVMQYYYQGVCSWQWFYPYHYAPFASDFCGLDKLEIQFTLGKPFRPFDQLMAVLPAASAHALPFFYRKLILDSSSPILDFYPTDFELDMNGKRHSWQAICKLPFIEESRLLAELAKVEQTLTEDEKQRNRLGLDILFMHKTHPLAAKILNFCNNEKQRWPLDNVKRDIDPKYSVGMNGYVYISTESMCPAEINSPVEDMPTIVNNEVVSLFYENPSFHPHIPKPPEGVHMRKTKVKEKDILPPPVLWHETSAVRARVLSERTILKSISGPRLAKLCHDLVCKYIQAMPSEGQVCVVAHSKVVLELLGEEELNGGKENYVSTVGDKEPDGASSNHISRRAMRRKRQKAKKTNSYHIAASEGKEQDGGSNKHTVLVGHNSGVSRKESGGSENHIVVEPKKRKRKGKKSEEDPVTTCDKMEADGGNENHVNSVGQVHVPVGKEPDGGSENHIGIEPNKKKRRRKGKKKSSENGSDGGHETLITTFGGKEADEGSDSHIAAVDGKEPDRENDVAAIGLKELEGGHDNAIKAQNGVGRSSRRKKKRRISNDSNNGA